MKPKPLQKVNDGLREGPGTSNTCTKVKSVKRSPYQRLINHTDAKDVLQRNSEQQGQVGEENNPPNNI